MDTYMEKDDNWWNLKKKEEQIYCLWISKWMEITLHEKKAGSTFPLVDFEQCCQEPAWNPGSTLEEQQFTAAAP